MRRRGLGLGEGVGNSFSLLEKRLHVAVEEVFGDAAGDGFAVVFECLKIGLAELCCDFETYVEKLADVGIVGGVALIVAERTGELIAGPGIDGFFRGEFREVDVDDGGIGFAEGFLFPECLAVDFLGEGETGAAGFREADNFLEPVGAGGLDVEAGAGAGEGAFDRRVDGEFVGAGVDGKFQAPREAVGFDGVRDDGEVVVEFLSRTG